MKNTNKLLCVLCALGLSGCHSADTIAQNEDVAQSIPACAQETMIVVYDENGAYQVPACMDYVEMPCAYNEAPIMPTTETLMAPLTQSDEPVKEECSGVWKKEKSELEVDTLEGEFPDVENNKYFDNQVVLQNLQTRVLAYCRGTDEEISECVDRLDCAGYVRLTDVPQVVAKYDLLKKGTYPTRRWRNGEYVPRW